MVRWESDSQGRLARAAMALYSERGFEQTTVAEIARRAGLTERTFFRHYADKREVLFWGSNRLQEIFVGAVASAPADATPFAAMAAALDAVATFLEEGRPHSRQRQAIIDANAALQEREAIKLASLSTVLAGALRERGVGEPAASLAAEAAIAVFKVGFERWVAPDTEHTLQRCIHEALAELRGVLAAS